MSAITADAFAAALRTAGCRVEVDRNYTGAVYLRASKVGEQGTDVWIVFENDKGFRRAFVPDPGISRRRWTKFRTMKAVRSFLGVQAEAGAKRCTLQPAAGGFGYVTSDGRYKVTPAYSPTHMGGSTSRPSSWTLTDLHGEYAIRTRTLLSDIRDILKERP